MLFLKPYFKLHDLDFACGHLQIMWVWLVQQGAGFKSTYRGLPAIYAPIAVATTYWPFRLSSALLHREDWLTERECSRSRHGYLHERHP